MKRRYLTILMALLLALCLAACNSDSGPERTTPAEFGEVTFSPAEVAPDTDVTVEAFVTSQYGFHRIDSFISSTMMIPTCGLRRSCAHSKPKLRR